MSADRKAAFETATQWVGLRAEGLVNPPADNLAAAYLELHANLEKFRQAEIRWIDTLAAKDAELEQERIAKLRWMDGAKQWAAKFEQARKAREVSTEEWNTMYAECHKEYQRAEAAEAKLATVRAETIEECAKVCDLLTMGGSDAPCAKGAARCARAIRALSAQPNAATQIRPERGEVVAGLGTAAKPSLEVPEHDSAPAAAHTDHPTRHWDRTCPACNSTVSDPVLEGLELAAKICDSMVIGGRAWNAGQEAAAKVLFAAAAEIRAEIERRRNKP